MRQSLNIPFSRNTTTTRHPRRVVWMIAAIVLAGLLLTWQAGFVWLTRAHIFAAAPEGTQAAVHLLLTRQTWPILNDLLGDVPLISDRDLTIDDVAPYARGEIGWFFQDDGSRSLALRVRKEALPMELLDAKQIVVQEAAPGIFLLSKKLQAVSGITSRRPLSALFPTFSRTLGSYTEQGWSRISRLTYRKNQIRLRLPVPSTGPKREKLTQIPTDLRMAITTPIGTGQERVSQIFSTLADPLLSMSVSETTRQILTTKSAILIGNAQDFLVQSAIDLPEEARTDLIRAVLALKNPSKRRFYLEDGTYAEELIADPDLVSVENRTIAGRIFQHASTEQTSLFVSTQGTFILSNNEELVRQWLNPDTEGQTVSDLCPANVGIVSASALTDPASFPNQSYTPSAVRQLLSKIEYIGLKQSKRSLVVTLCM